MKRCPCCSGCYPDDIIYCPVCGGGNKVELATREEYQNHTGKGFETVKNGNILKKRYTNIKNDFDKIQDKREARERQECADEERRQQQNVPRCPTCGSTHVHKISGLDRAASVMLFGIFSKKINKSFKCDNCGYTW